jgi:peptidoglycan-N-acetylglucosamine deacetylase
MNRKKIYLTIDDFPSKWGAEKIDFLVSQRIPAILYCRGEFLEQYLDFAVYAIEHGFLLGNHSYSHPHFSDLSLAACQIEINRTEQLIQMAYQKSRTLRPLKTIRFPFGTGGPEGLETYLANCGFQKAAFLSLAASQSYSVPWTIDTLDYKPRLTREPIKLVEILKDELEHSIRAEEVLLMHDFDHNQDGFIQMIHALQQYNGLEFAIPNFVGKDEK